MALDAELSPVFDLSYLTVATTPTAANLSGESRLVQSPQCYESDVSQYYGGNPSEATNDYIVGRYRKLFFPALHFETLESVNGRGTFNNLDSPWVPNESQVRSQKAKSKGHLLCSLPSSLLCRRNHMCMPALWDAMAGNNTLSNSDYMSQVISAHTGGKNSGRPHRIELKLTKVMKQDVLKIFGGKPYHTGYFCSNHTKL